MTYEEYLQNWENRFGDDEVGDYEYFVMHQRVPCQVTRLSQEEFERHSTALAEASDNFVRALEDNDDKEMEDALAKAFPHELVLLI